MKKETFVKLVNAWKKEQARLKTRTNPNTDLSEAVFDILDDVCCFYWWIDQKPKTGHCNGVDYPVETPEEFWEYTQICERSYKKKVFDGISKGLEEVVEGKVIKVGNGKELDKFFKNL